MKLLHPGTVVLIGFGGMILFMTYLVFQCTQNPSVMVNDNYYEQELVYQKTIDARNNTTLLQDEFVMNKEDQQVLFTLPTSINANLQNLDIGFYNYADNKKDKLIQFTQSQPAYTVPLKDIAVGNYKIKLNLNAGGTKYYKEFSLTL